MFGLMASTRSVAVLRVTSDGLVTYRNTKSSRTAGLGRIPGDALPHNVLQISGRKPGFRQGYVVIGVRTPGGALDLGGRPHLLVYAAQLSRKFRLGPWQLIP